MEEILGYINNSFAVTKEEGTFNISNNSITIKGNYIEGQYIRLTGSILNDGVYKVESTEGNTITLVGAIDEVFEGAIYSLAIPKEIVRIAGAFEEAKEKIGNGIYDSESFGEYSYTLAKKQNGEIYTALDGFKNDLKKYRKMNDNSLKRCKVIK